MTDAATAQAIANTLLVVLALLFVGLTVLLIVTRRIGHIKITNYDRDDRDDRERFTQDTGQEFKQVVGPVTWKLDD